jgi:hypothetical protein
MPKINIDLLRTTPENLKRGEHIIESCCAEFGLTQTLKGGVSTIPGAVHWHYKFGKVSGTLEITLVAAEGRVWATMRENRAAGWIEPMVEEIRKALNAAVRM